LVTRAIEDKGVEAYEGSVRFIHELRSHDFKVAVVSSSENCEAVLKAAKVDGLFEVRVDGAMVEAQHLAGKPAPDTFLIAAKLLGVDPRRAIVVEDALSGVEAGLAGKFGLVVGVARRDNADELRRHGAHLVVNDLSELLD
jgi:HAD superfamily hydrolase (TIGR01509 family)